MKILYFTDPHNADEPPRMRVDGYREQILQKQANLISPAKKCDMVICGGDVFHSKKAHRVSYKLTNLLCEIYREYPGMLIVPGNHDVDTRLEWGDRPLGILDKLPNVTVANHHKIVCDRIDIALLGGGETFYTEDEVLKFFSGVKLEERFMVGVLHYPVVASPGGSSEYPFQVIRSHLFKGLVDYLLVGHLHDQQLCLKRFMAPGGLSRGILKIDESLSRAVYYGVIDVTGAKVTSELIELDVSPFDEVFKMEEKAELEKKKAVINSFVEYIHTFQSPRTLSKADLVDYINSMTIPEDVKKEALRILGGL